jgi:regulator of RNase E activity RraA
MIITYHAGEAVKVSAGDTTLAFGPVSKESKLKSMSFGSDVVFVSANHPDMNGVAEASRGDKAPFAINGPGEYEVGSITAAGFATKTFYGGKELINTIYTVTMDGLHVLYLGAIGEMQLPADAIEAIEDVDVVFVPIGGSGVLDAQEAHKLAVKLEAKIIIPIHWEGVVIYGCIRDSGDINGIDIGVRALNTHPQKSIKKGAGDRDLAVTFGGVTFNPGEYLYADEDGVLVSSKPLC